jgi:hypothetical protein
MPAGSWVHHHQLRAIETWVCVFIVIEHSGAPAALSTLPWNFSACGPGVIYICNMFKNRDLAHG